MSLGFSAIDRFEFISICRKSPDVGLEDPLNWFIVQERFHFRFIRLANASGHIEFIILLIMNWSFAPGCSPPRLSATQFPSATDSQCLSYEDFHLIVGANFQTH
jgi:hypothetical protein